MDAVTLLKKQHKQVKSWFKEFRGLDDEDATGQEKLFVQIADALATHCTIEEKIFYPRVRDASDEDELYEAAEEHLGAKRLIADLLDVEPGTPVYRAKMTVLEEMVSHHVEEEEGELFPHVQKAMEKGDLEAMGLEMEETFNALIQTEPRNQVPSETQEAAPLDV